jgi:hypothetical protein
VQRAEPLAADPGQHAPDLGGVDQPGIELIFPGAIEPRGAPRQLAVAAAEIDDAGAREAEIQAMTTL